MCSRDVVDFLLFRLGVGVCVVLGCAYVRVCGMASGAVGALLLVGVCCGKLGVMWGHML